MFDLRPIDRSPEGLRETCALLNRVWPAAAHITPEYLDWQYNRNPVDPALGFNAFAEDGTLVAHYVLHPIRTWLFGAQQAGLIAFNLSTHPDYRGRGLFRLVAERTFEEARARGYDFFYGVTNAMSTRVFEGWGFQIVCPLQVKVGLGPTPPRRDDGGREFVRVWDATTVAWRLADAQRAFSVEARGESRAVYAATGRMGVHVELACLPRGLVPASVPRFRPWNPVRLWMGVDSSRNWTGARYVDLPRRLRPVPLILMFGDLSGRGRRVDAARVRFDALDFDAF